MEEFDIVAVWLRDEQHGSRKHLVGEGRIWQNIVC